jgi:methionyl-tRNA formyltransferase
MRILFMGTAELACPCLEAVTHLAGHELVGVITQPDRPKGRALQLTPPPVKVTAHQLHLPVHQPLKMRDPAAVDLVQSLKPDLIAVVAYGQILPASVLEIPSKGCINVHTSLLPRWRGASPIQSAILHGDNATGVTTMYLNERMDEGDIIFQKVEPILPDDTSAKLHDRLASLGAGLLAETVEAIANSAAPRQTQDPALVTYAKKFTKEDGRVDWSKPAVEIERQVRAFDPWPGTFTFLGEMLMKLWKVEVLVDVVLAPGEIRGDIVGTGQGGLRLIEVQPAGKKRMEYNVFVRGHPVDGKRFTT